MTTLCAFIKRLASMALQFRAPNDVISVLKQTKALLLSNSKTRSLFDKESEALGEFCWIVFSIMTCQWCLLAMA